MASWSENRSAGGEKPKAAVVLERVRQVNAVLAKLAEDEDFQDRLQLPLVKKALMHWTNQQRLSPDEAQHLQDSRDVVYVLQRFQMIQSVCREALLPTPLELLLSRAKALPQATVDSLLKGTEGTRETKPQPTTTTKADKSQKPTSSIATPSPSTSPAPAPVTPKQSTPAEQQQQRQQQPVPVNDANSSRFLVAVVVLAAALLTAFYRQYFGKST